MMGMGMTGLFGEPWEIPMSWYGRLLGDNMMLMMMTYFKLFVHV